MPKHSESAAALSPFGIEHNSYAYGLGSAGKILRSTHVIGCFTRNGDVMGMALLYA